MPTPFTKQNLFKSNGHVYYVDPVTHQTRFVARFKYAAGSSAGPFMTFLRRNFTVEEYFARMDAGESPLPIVESKGFILSHIKRWLRQGGYPVTREGYAQFLADQVAKYKARDAAQAGA